MSGNRDELLRGFAQDTDMRRANLFGADLLGAYLRDADLRGAHLQDARVPSCRARA